MNQRSHKKQLVKSIKDSMSMSKSVPPTARSKQLQQSSSYPSFVNTLIDYSKSHNITPRSESSATPAFYNLDQQESPKKQSEDKHIAHEQEEYDEEIMNAIIEMEMYESRGEENGKDENGRDKNGRKVSEEENASENYEGMIKIELDDNTEENQNGIVIDNPIISRKVNRQYQPKENQFVAKKTPTLKTSTLKTSTLKTPTFKPSFQPVPKRNQQNFEEIQESKITEKPQTPQKPKRQLRRLYELSIGQPAKKLNHTIPIIPELRKFINFSIDIKLLRANEKIRRVIQCVQGPGSKHEAKYLVQLDNRKREQKIIGNAEMNYFYKDVLIDYYQTLHFS